MSKPHIPVYEPEVIAAEANKHRRGDTEKVATTSVGETHYEGIRISSRYSKAHEMKLMLLMVDGVDPHLRSYIEFLECDSKATSVYEVKMRNPVKIETARSIGMQMSTVCKAEAGGHNGIYISNHRSCDIEVGPDWD